MSITHPSYAGPSSRLLTVAKKHAGVVDNSQSIATPPLNCTPRANASFNDGPDNRGSRPMPTVHIGLLVHFSVSLNQSTKAQPKQNTDSGVMVIGSFSTPANATPRTSDPFCNRFNDSGVVFGISEEEDKAEKEEDGRRFRR